MIDTSHIFSLLGRRVSLLSPEGETLGEYRAVIQPLRYKNKMYLDGVNTEIGFNSQGHYLCIGPPLPDLTAAPEGSRVLAGGVEYKIDRAEKFYAGEEPAYIWAVIREVIAAG